MRQAIATQVLRLGKPSKESKQLTGLDVTQLGRLGSELLIKQ